LAVSHSSWERDVVNATAAALAHQGGWDEALFVAVPIVVLLALLALAQRRASAEHDAEQQASPPPGPDER
jgi:hypothetical protein